MVQGIILIIITFGNFLIYVVIGRVWRSMILWNFTFCNTSIEVCWVMTHDYDIHIMKIPILFLLSTFLFNNPICAYIRRFFTFKQRFLKNFYIFNAKTILKKKYHLLDKSIFSGDLIKYICTTRNKCIDRDTHSAILKKRKWI